jgi:hypothetical protein
LEISEEADVEMRQPFQFHLRFSYRIETTKFLQMILSLLLMGFSMTESGFSLF